MKGGRIIRESKDVPWIIEYLSDDDTVFDQYRKIELEVLNGFLRNSSYVDSNLALEHELEIFVANYRKLSNDSKRSPENTALFDALVKCRDDILDIIRLRNEGMRQKTIIGPKTKVESSKQRGHVNRRRYWEKILVEIEPILEETRVHNEHANTQRILDEDRRNAEAAAIKEQQELRRIEKEFNPESSHTVSDEDLARYLNEEEQRNAFRDDLVRRKRESEVVPPVKPFVTVVPPKVEKKQTKRVSVPDEKSENEFLEQSMQRTVLEKAKQERVEQTMAKLFKGLAVETQLIEKHKAIVLKRDALGGHSNAARLKTNAKSVELTAQLEELLKAGTAAAIQAKRQEISIQQKIVEKLLEEEETINGYDAELAAIDQTLSTLKRDILEWNKDAELLQANIDNPKFKLCANPDCCKEGKKECGRCRSVRYCGTECQTIHWPTHKPVCKAKGGYRTKRRTKAKKTRKRRTYK